MKIGKISLKLMDKSEKPKYKVHKSELNISG